MSREEISAWSMYAYLYVVLCCVCFWLRVNVDPVKTKLHCECKRICVFCCVVRVFD